MTDERTQMTEEQPQTTEEQSVAEEPAAEGAADEPMAKEAEVAGADGPAAQATPTGTPEAPADDDERAPLFAGEQAEGFRQRWETLQAGFVDNPRQMVEEADQLVDELIQELSAGFHDRRTALERQWEQEGEASTEDLRVALTRYRSFFNRLLEA